MTILPPLIFHPIAVERLWGGSRLHELYGKPLLAGRPVGETWEITDRPGAESVVAEGPFAGKTLRWLMASHGAALLGALPPHQDPALGIARFPWLIKCLDCRETLSLQVHPPEAQARLRGAEAKTEMWFVAKADPGAVLWAGLEQPVSREDLAGGAGRPEFASFLHRLPVREGDALFLPSGRVHAPGGGVVIFEVQENSDSTYRLYDWERTGPDGQPRALHIEAGLECIDMADIRPALAGDLWENRGGFRRRTIADCEAFTVMDYMCAGGSVVPWTSTGSVQAVGVVEGGLEFVSEILRGTLRPGQWMLLPASLAAIELRATSATRWLWVDPDGGMAARHGQRAR